MGKLGGREPNYHSDLDVVFLYEANGMTQHRHRGRRDTSTTNQHFFSQLAQRIIRIVTQSGPFGRLYEMDTRLRPAGSSGPLTLSFEELAKYFQDGSGQLWERQALCKARPIYGSQQARSAAMDCVRRAILSRPWSSDDRAAIVRMRRRLEETASARNLKRGAGGTMDVEFIVQALQIQHARARPEVLVTGTLEALRQLQESSVVDATIAGDLAEAYRFLRRVEARLRLLETTARHELPEDSGELRRLAFLMEYDDPQRLLDECRAVMGRTRAIFQQQFGGGG